jgi:hypothetical protein
MRLAIDAVLLIFSPNCDPDMIAPTQPMLHALFFQYKVLGRLCLDTLRIVGRPMMLVGRS